MLLCWQLYSSRGCHSKIYEVHNHCFRLLILFKMLFCKFVLVIIFGLFSVVSITNMKCIKKIKTNRSQKKLTQVHPQSQSPEVSAALDKDDGDIRTEEIIVKELELVEYLIHKISNDSRIFKKNLKKKVIGKKK